MRRDRGLMSDRTGRRPTSIAEFIGIRGAWGTTEGSGETPKANVCVENLQLERAH
jgi:hypothetical protein